MTDELSLPVMWSWSDFLDRATAADSITTGVGRRSGREWAGAGWDEAVRLAVDGWAAGVPEIDLAIGELRDRISHDVGATGLVQVAGVSGSEVDVAAYLAGIPECMLDTEPAPVSRHGRVVTFLVPAAYSHTVDHAAITHRGRALCALGAAVVGAGHSVEVWSGYTCRVRGPRRRAMARVISPGEPFDPGRLMFAMAHPAMLRRLWFGVWDSAPAEIAAPMAAAHYGSPPYDCTIADLPGGIRDAYVLPYLDAGRRWASWETAMAWSVRTYGELGLIAGTAGVQPRW